MVIEKAMEFGKIGGSLLMTPIGMILAGVFLLLGVFALMSFGLCCLFAPSIIGALAVFLIGVGAFFIIPHPMFRIIIPLALWVTAVIIYLQPHWFNMVV